MNNFSLLAGAIPFLAQTTAPQVPDLPRTKSILDTLIAAGPVMYVLLAMSIVLVARQQSARRSEERPDGFSVDDTP